MRAGPRLPPLQPSLCCWPAAARWPSPWPRAWGGPASGSSRPTSPPPTTWATWPPRRRCGRSRRRWGRQRGGPWVQLRHRVGAGGPACSLAGWAPATKARSPSLLPLYHTPKCFGPPNTFSPPWLPPPPTAAAGPGQQRAAAAGAGGGGPPRGGHSGVGSGAQRARRAALCRPPLAAVSLAQPGGCLLRAGGACGVAALWEYHSRRSSHCPSRVCPAASKACTG